MLKMKTMTQEEKQLLLNALCGYLSYGIKAQLTELDDNDGSEYYIECRIMGVKDNQLVNFIRIINSKEIGEEQWFDISFFKPYLRPMSSMTEEEWKNFRRTLDGGDCEMNDDGETDFIMLWFEPCQLKSAYNCLDYLNSIHIDYRGLIKKGLALEAPDGMYNFK